ncbi:hypothetical protein BSPWISOXPB_11255 [uncultured Gammaproteobacteria bacterium]|nr:hypothetical protein BSPWISOXPB_11255 [uncultured Gammaproteobacteria bacterium]
MFVKGEQNIEIAPILIIANNKQLTLKITGQSLILRRQSQIRIK